MTDSEGKPTVDRVLVEMTIAASAEAVWDALKDPVKIYNWHGWDDPSLGEEIKYIYVDAIRDEAAMVMGFEGFGDRFEVEAKGVDYGLGKVLKGSAARKLDVAIETAA